MNLNIHMYIDHIYMYMYIHILVTELQLYLYINGWLIEKNMKYMSLCIPLLHLQSIIQLQKSQSKRDQEKSF